MQQAIENRRHSPPSARCAYCGGELDEVRGGHDRDLCWRCAPRCAGCNGVLAGDDARYADCSACAAVRSGVPRELAGLREGARLLIEAWERLAEQYEERPLPVPASRVSAAVLRACAADLRILFASDTATDTEADATEIGGAA